MAYWGRGTDTEVQTEPKFRPKAGRGRPQLLRHGASAPIDATVARKALSIGRGLNVRHGESACTPTTPLLSNL